MPYIFGTKTQRLWKEICFLESVHIYTFSSIYVDIHGWQLFAILVVEEGLYEKDDDFEFPVIPW